MQPRDLGASGPRRLQLGRLSASPLSLLQVPLTRHAPFSPSGASPPTHPQQPAPTRPPPPARTAQAHAQGPCWGGGGLRSPPLGPSHTLQLSWIPFNARGKVPSCPSPACRGLFAALWTAIRDGGRAVPLLLHPFFLSSCPLLFPRSREGRAVGQIERALDSSTSSSPNFLCDPRRVLCLLWALGSLYIEVGVNDLKVSQLLAEVAITYRP